MNLFREKEYIRSTGTSFITKWQEHKHNMFKKVQSKPLTKLTTSNKIELNGKYYSKPTAKYQKIKITALSAI